MKRVTNNLLILIIFLSPIVNGFEMGHCHSKKATQSSHHTICHDDKQQIMHTICIGDCCQNCQCDGLMTAVLLIKPSINMVNFMYPYKDKIDYRVFVPFQEPQTLFRPPIV